MNTAYLGLILTGIGLVVTLITAAVKITNSINKSAEVNAASRAELTESNKALRKSLDDFKLTSREEHRDFRKKLEEDAQMLAKHGEQLSSHEKRINKLEGRKEK